MIRVDPNFFVAYKILGDIRYYHWAVLCAEELIRTLKRANHTFGDYVHGKQRTFKLFAHGPFKATRPPTPPDPIDFHVDVNQNAEIGLAYGLLAAERMPFPSSIAGASGDPIPITLTKALCQEIALGETLASMGPQAKTGEIPLVDSSPQNGPDTMYGSYTAFCWVWVNALNIFEPSIGTDFRYARSEFAAHIALAANWLMTKMDLARGRDKYYPWPPTRELAVTPSEAAWRIALYDFARTPGYSRFTDDVFARIERVRVDPSDPSSTAPWAYHATMGLPSLCELGIS